MNAKSLITLALTMGLLAIAGTLLAKASAEVNPAQPNVMVAMPQASVTYVDKDAPGSTHNGLSWATAYTDVQQALTKAISGTEIWVAEDAYYPGAYAASTFSLTNGVALYGGFAATETLRTQRNWAAHVTILSGDIDRNDSNADGNFIDETWADIQGNNAFHIVTGSGTDNTAVLDGFTVTGGTGAEGGGMYNSYGNPTLTNLTFSGNRTSWGGGMINYYSNPTLANVTFSGNRAGSSGGGMYNYHSHPTLANVMFSGNRADSSGGGMDNYYSNPTLTNVIFSGNSSDDATSGGGGIYDYFSNPKLTNVTFSGNRANTLGGGMLNDGSSPRLTNVTFSGNRANADGGGMYNLNNSRPTLVNSILWSNSPDEIYNESSVSTVTYSDVRGGYAGTGNINSDPQFSAPVAATAAPTTLGNYRLYCNSPAIDTGNTLSVTVATDLDGHPRVQGSAVDMGAYEKTATPAACLRLVKSVTPTLAAPGAPITYAIKFKNEVGIYAITATAVVITDIIPISVTNTSILSSGVIITQTAGLRYAWQVQDLAPGQGGVITIAGYLSQALPVPLNVLNTATITTHAGDDDPGDNTSTASVLLSHIFYVDKDAPGPTHDGLSWTTAYTGVQDALAAAQNGYEIWVAEGVYYPGALVTSTFMLTNGVTLYGGFVGTETSRAQRDWTVHVTVLSGDIDHDDITDAHGVVTTTANITGSNAYHVVYANNVNGAAVLDGFTLTAGKASGSYPIDSNGGGMYNSNSSPQIANVTFTGNWAGYQGAGMYNTSGNNPTLTNVTFSGNRANADGGGMYNLYSNPALTNVTFGGNGAGSSGGGMVNSSSSPRLTNVTFNGNQTSANGGAMFNSSSSPSLTNVTFSGNRASSNGGAMYNNYSSPRLTNVMFSSNQAEAGGGLYNISYSSPRLTNMTFSGNRADIGGGMYNEYNSDPTLVNCILWRDSPDEIYNNSSVPIITYSDVYTTTGVYSGTGNINLDPQFIAPITATAAPTTTGNYRLLDGSPAIDAGNTLSVTVPTDLDGNPRVSGAAVDMGAFEYQSTKALAVTKQASPDPVQAGAQLTYTIRVTNTGGSMLSGVVTDSLPAHVTPTGSLTWPLTSLASTDVWTQTVVVTVEIGYAGPLTNVVQVATLEGDRATYTATSQAQVTALRVTKQASSATVRAGEQLTYTLCITNTGNVTLTGLVTDTLPANVTPGGIQTWRLDNLAPGKVWTRPVVVTVTLGYSGILTNSVQVITHQGVTGTNQAIVNALGYQIYLPLVIKN